MAETGGQAPHESGDEDLKPKTSARRVVDWDTGFVLYCQDHNATEIGRAIGVARESVQRHIKIDGWKAKRDLARGASQHVRAKVDKQPPIANEIVALEADRAASLAIEIIETRLTELKDAKAGGADQLQKLTYALARATQMRRQSRGMAANEGFAPREDRKLEVVIRRLPATRAEYDALPPAEPETVPA